ncbi:MAG: hypothetical protein GXY48_09370 [Methanomicrobiales archaeon]|nr:hypothetical protein [Methanomicrobiales archaeon]
MKSDNILLCPFDKNSCIQNRCAVWSEEKHTCSFSVLPDLLKKEVISSSPAKKESGTQKSESGSGKYRTLLFD